MTLDAGRLPLHPQSRPRASSRCAKKSKPKPAGDFGGSSVACWQSSYTRWHYINSRIVRQTQFYASGGSLSPKGREPPGFEPCWGGVAVDIESRFGAYAFRVLPTDRISGKRISNPEPPANRALSSFPVFPSTQRSGIWRLGRDARIHRRLDLKRQ